MEEKKRKFYKKWWFWLLILILSIISALSIVLLTTNISKQNTKQNIGQKITNQNDIYVIAAQIQNIYENTTLYSSAGKKTLILELKKFDTKENEVELREIVNVIKSNMEEKLSTYRELVILTYMDNNETNNYMILKSTYNLPDFTKNEEESCNYINFKDYTKLFDNYEEAVNDYKDLFMSIGR